MTQPIAAVYLILKLILSQIAPYQLPDKYYQAVSSHKRLEFCMFHTKMLILVTLLVFPLLALAQDQYLMTVSGYIGSLANPNLPWDNHVNLLSLDPNVQVPECLQGLNYFRYLEGACMAVLLEDQPHVCAGWDAYNGYNDKCYRYDPLLDSWTESGTLTVQRREHFGCTFSYAHGMVIAGGFGIDNAAPALLDTVEYTMHGNVFGKLPDLPHKVQSDCFVALWGGDLFIAGGNAFGLDFLQIMLFSSPLCNKFSLVPVIL